MNQLVTHLLSAAAASRFILLPLPLSRILCTVHPQPPSLWVVVDINADGSLRSQSRAVAVTQLYTETCRISLCQVCMWPSRHRCVVCTCERWNWWAVSKMKLPRHFWINVIIFRNFQSIPYGSSDFDEIWYNDAVRHLWSFLPLKFEIKKIQDSWDYILKNPKITISRQRFDRSA